MEIGDWLRVGDRIFRHRFPAVRLQREWGTVTQDLSSATALQECLDYHQSNWTRLSILHSRPFTSHAYLPARTSHLICQRLLVHKVQLYHDQVRRLMGPISRRRQGFGGGTYCVNSLSGGAKSLKATVLCTASTACSEGVPKVILSTGAIPRRICSLKAAAGIRLVIHKLPIFPKHYAKTLGSMFMFDDGYISTVNSALKPLIRQWRPRVWVIEIKGF